MRRDGSVLPLSKRAVVLAFAALFGCDFEDEAIPVGKLARVGDSVLGPRDLSSVQSQLGPYGELRFRGPEGQYQLLGALVETELLAQEARDRGLGDDPRVQYAILEELAAIHAASELERAVPQHEVAADEAALRAAHARAQEAFTRPERRSMEAIVVVSLPQGLETLSRLRAGEVELDDVGEPFQIRPIARDDAEYPLFHPFLFDPALGVGDWLPTPVLVGKTLLVGRIAEVQPAELEPFEDPEVQERLAARVRQPLADAARTEIEDRLQRVYPEVPSD